MSQLRSSERAREILERLIAEHHTLRASGADAATVEANRRAISYWQAQTGRPPRRRRPA